MAGKLYLIPSSLGDHPTGVMPNDAINIVHGLKVFIAERAKTARRFLKTLKTPVPFPEMEIYELNKHTPEQEINAFLDKAIHENTDIGLLSEAGCPGVADPGARIVMMAHQNNIQVMPLIGPSSILLALMASGMNGQQFAFKGYLPIKTPERVKALKSLENLAQRFNQTQIFIETPYRNNGLVQDALKSLSNDTLFCIAADLTQPSQYVSTKQVGQWKKNGPPDLNKRPAVFLIYR
ncbi:MAG: SAM-dependent methyltransferase [Bacteroidota bacterium]